MGIFGNLFKKGKEYPLLDPACEAAKKLDALRETLGAWAKNISHPIEVVPAEKAAYLFIGNPPEQFGLGWIKDGKLSILKKVVDERKIPLEEFQSISNSLRKAYEQSLSAGRFHVIIENKKIIVTPSESLGKEIEQTIIQLVG